MSKKNKIIIGVISCIIVILLVVLVFVMYSKRNDTTNPETTIYKFSKALNNDNINNMLECIEPSEAQLIQAGLDKIENITDTSLGKLIDLLPFITYISDANLFPEYDIEVLSSDIKDDTNAIVTIVATSKENNSNSNTLDVYMIKIQDVWYIQYAKVVNND